MTDTKTTAALRKAEELAAQAQAAAEDLLEAADALPAQYGPYREQAAKLYHAAEAMADTAGAALDKAEAR